MSHDISIKIVYRTTTVGITQSKTILLKGRMLSICREAACCLEIAASHLLGPTEGHHFLCGGRELRIGIHSAATILFVDLPQLHPEEIRPKAHGREADGVDWRCG